MMPYERLLAWEACHALAIKVHQVTKTWPTAERYGLTAQIRRAAFSAPTNIAEGSARRGVGELGRFLDAALGSLSEVSYLLRVARDLSLIDEDQYQLLAEAHQAAGRLTWGLYAGVRRKQPNPGT